LEAVLMEEPIIVSNIDPKLIKRWKRGSPDYYQDLLYGLEMWAVIRRGGDDLITLQTSFFKPGEFPPSFQKAPT
jgi:hypothetical protein